MANRKRIYGISVFTVTFLFFVSRYSDARASPRTCSSENDRLPPPSHPGVCPRQPTVEITDDIISPEVLEYRNGYVGCSSWNGPPNLAPSARPPIPYLLGRFASAADR